MDNTQRAIITLLRAAVTGEKLPLPADFSLEEAQPYIRRHNIATLAYAGAVNCGIPRTDPAMKALFRDYCRYLLISEGQERALERIFAAFDENGIDYMPLKGCNMKALYPKPEMRVMGDADILIRLEQYDKIKPLMKDLQYEEVKESSYDLCWQGKQLYAELHKQFFGARQADLCGYFGDGWKRAVKGDGTRYNMGLEDEYVYIFSHMMKHFRYCGIGVNQIVDLYVFRKAYPALEESKVEEIMARIGVLDFYRNIRHLLTVWFDGEPYDSRTEFITEYVFGSGSWGTMQNKLYSEELIKSQRSGNTQNAKGKSLIEALFLPLPDMQNSYNILYKYPVLLPVFWVVRWFDVFLHRRKNIGKKFAIICDMTDEKVEAYRRSLEYMGLDYRFVEEDD